MYVILFKPAENFTVEFGTRFISSIARICFKFHLKFIFQTQYNAAAFKARTKVRSKNRDKRATSTMYS